MRIESCSEVYHNLDMAVENGCEFGPCLFTNGGVEVCDGVDNDCDSRADEGFDIQTDLAHCGACNRACALENALPTCQMGMCLIAQCNEGWVDLDMRAPNGCEYECTPSNDGIEICDNIDNDCDGQIDENLTQVCGSDVGACGQGEQRCEAGNWGECVGEIGPAVRPVTTRQ